MCIPTLLVLIGCSHQCVSSSPVALHLSPFGSSSMPGKRSYHNVAVGPLTAAQTRRQASDWWYCSAHTLPGLKFVEVPSAVADDIKQMAVAKTRHLVLDNQIAGITPLASGTHHLRVASEKAKHLDIIDRDTALRDRALNKTAGAAKHRSRRLHGSSLQDCKDWLSNQPPRKPKDVQKPPQDPPCSTASGLSSSLSRPIPVGSDWADAAIGTDDLASDLRIDADPSFRLPNVSMISSL